MEGATHATPAAKTANSPNQREQISAFSSLLANTPLDGSDKHLEDPESEVLATPRAAAPAAAREKLTNRKWREAATVRQAVLDIPYDGYGATPGLAPAAAETKNPPDGPEQREVEAFTLFMSDISDDSDMGLEERVRESEGRGASSGVTSGQASG
ncbi:hypothetical protein HK097_006416 [Rhizophlyctis rosea]|uniref:Uncharacterized protein n=1 Tax=Rhizophlyctis rosea TaxID=64517 RepID=A0AAD5X4R0_9FUNG|nr:hypothetical protein HK097_006416 [Rhizophlyctis rosea]